MDYPPFQIDPQTFAMPTMQVQDLSMPMPTYQAMPQTGLAALMQNPQFLQGLAALGGAGQQRMAQPYPMHAPDPLGFNGRPYMAQFNNLPFMPALAMAGYDRRRR